jgi:enoyl-CoA hydratase/carnithine racemase
VCVTSNPASGNCAGADRVSLRQLAEGAAQFPLLDPDGQTSVPLVLVDLNEAPDTVLLAKAAGAARSAERVLVGMRAQVPLVAPWHPLLSALDLTLSETGQKALPRSCVPLPDPSAAGDALLAAAAASPQAAVALAQVLRASERLGVRAALNVESYAYSTLLGGAEFRRWLAGKPRRPPAPPGLGPAVIAEREGGILRITLNRPARRNAYSRGMRDALTEALLVPALDPTIEQVVITGAGPSFCSGGDLDEFGTAPDAATAHFVRTSGGAAGLLHCLAGRTEARVHGACVGAGMELAAFAGRVVADPGTTVQLPEVAMGLIPGAGGTVSIPRRIGRWRTMYLALSGIKLDAETAVSWGLADGLTTDLTDGYAARDLNPEPAD